MTQLSIYQEPPAQPGRTKISTANYCETIFEHPELTKIIGVLTYDTLHLLHKKIKSNTMAVHSNIGGGQHRYLGLVVSPNSCALLSNTLFVSNIHPLNLVIPVVATHQAQDELKRQYEKNLRVFHETRGVEQALIQQLVLPVKVKYITATRNRITFQSSGNLFLLIQYIIVTYGKISPSQLVDLEQDIKEMYYNSQSAIYSVFNQVEDLLEHRELTRYT